MNRREFTKSVLISAIGFQFISHNYPQRFSVEELTGRTKPKLFGPATLREEAASAFARMKKAAQADGISIEVASSFRSYYRQEQIWNGKYQRFTKQGMKPTDAIKKIIEYSTIPGTSRHHWGTEVDIIQGGKPKQQDSLLAKHFNEGGVYRELKLWLDSNKEKYDFYEVYTNKPGRTGFKYEPWHFSYKPLSFPMLQEYVKIDLKSFLQKIELMGSEHFTDEFIEKYRTENVMDINPSLI